MKLLQVIIALIIKMEEKSLKITTFKIISILFLKFKNYLK
jgi:hypothetical protein